MWGYVSDMLHVQRSEGSFRIYQKSLKTEAKEFIKHFLIKAFLCKFPVRHVKKEGGRPHI